MTKKRKTSPKKTLKASPRRKAVPGRAKAADPLLAPVKGAERRNIDLAEYPSVKRWHDEMAARPAVQRGVAVLADRARQGSITDAERENYFGKTQFAAR